jgi:hypothetical protein
MPDMDLERKIRALKNIRKLSGVPKEIKELEDLQMLEEDRLNKKAEIDSRYGVEPELEIEDQVEPNFNDVIRGLDKEINTLDENDANFDEDYQRLMRRREALIKLNS